MLSISSQPRLTSFLVKVASRCNLDCDYCYVYHHADQSWRLMPKFLSLRHQADFGARLKEYAAAVELKHAAVIFHGGEPLLLGAEALADFAGQLRQAVGSRLVLDIGMQTNGVLLSAQTVRVLKDANISVSLSLDGPRQANDLHRNTRAGRSSFERAYAGLQQLRQAPEIFAGVICVIDPRVSPLTLLEFFSEQGVPRLDFLLPDAHHQRSPPGRAADPQLYCRWLIQAFDAWLDHFPTLPIRTFEALLDALAGLPSHTDAFGFGDVSLICIETDGQYHDLDVLKITRDGGAPLSGGVSDTPIAQVASSSALDAHRRLLRKEGLCEQCQACDIVDVCGGGAVPHRFGLNGFRHPTIYCQEMKALVAHAKARVLHALRPSSHQSAGRAFDSASIQRFDLAQSSLNLTASLVESAASAQHRDLAEALEGLAAMSEPWAASASTLLHSGDVEKLALLPGAVAWSRATNAALSGKAVHAVDGTPVALDPTYVDWLKRCCADVHAPRLHLDDPWLRKPFGTAIYFEDPDRASRAMPVYLQACEIIRAWNPAVAQEMQMSCRDVQFVRDPSAHPDKIVSFSDNCVPGALYVSAYRADGLIDPYDMADSLVHEYRHQKLYLLERQGPMVVAAGAKVTSPWREDLRPPSGLFHALFVFVELKRFWEHVLAHGPAYLHPRAVAQLHDTAKNLRQGFATLKSCALTQVGAELAAVLEKASCL